MDVLAKAFQGVESSLFLKFLLFIFPGVAPAVVFLNADSLLMNLLFSLIIPLVAYLITDGIINLFTTSYRSYYCWLPLSLGFFILGYLSLAYYTSYYYAKIDHNLNYAEITYHFNSMVIGMVVFSIMYLIFYFMFDRGTLTIEGLVKLFGKSEKLERTDVRKLKKIKYSPYDPVKYFKDNEYFLGMSHFEKPMYISNDDYRSRHIQILGQTGAGKGVATMQLLYQGVFKGDGIYVIDPKGDKYAPHVLKKACDRYNVPFQYFDLSKLVVYLLIV